MTTSLSIMGRIWQEAFEAGKLAAKKAEREQDKAPPDENEVTPPDDEPQKKGKKKMKPAIEDDADADAYWNGVAATARAIVATARRTRNGEGAASTLHVKTGDAYWDWVRMSARQILNAGAKRRGEKECF